MQTNKFLSAIEKFYNLCCNPSENYGIFCHFGGYDKGFYGISICYNLDSAFLRIIMNVLVFDIF